MNEFNTSRAFVAPTSFHHINVGSRLVYKRVKPERVAAMAVTMAHRISHGLAHGGWTDLTPLGHDFALHVAQSGSVLEAGLYHSLYNPQEASPSVRLAIAVQPAHGQQAWQRLLQAAPSVAEVVSRNAPAVPWVASSVDVAPAIQRFGEMGLFSELMSHAEAIEEGLTWGFVHWLATEAYPVVC